MKHSLVTRIETQKARALCAAVLLFTSACHEDGTLYGVNGGAARLSISASSNAPGELVVVDIAYQRVAAPNVPMTTQSFSVTTAGNQQVTIPIDLTDCLLDASRVAPRENACSIVAAVALRSNGTTLDSTVAGPIIVAVGAIENLPQITLRAVGAVSVTAPSSLFAGDVATVTAVVRDRENQVITGRAVSWTSNNPAVLAISASGSATAVGAGVATISATSQGTIGTANITVAPNMTIQNVSPASAASDVSIEATVHVIFSENIDPLTVTPATVRLTLNGAGVDVTAIRMTASNMVELTPSAPLTEFASPYTLTVTTGVRSVSGNRLATNSTSTFTTAFWDPNYTYRLTNALRGPNESLDVLANTSTCFMVANSAALSQAFYFTPFGSSGYSTFSNVVSGTTKGLEGAVAPSRCFMLGPPFTPGLFTGTLWKPTSAAPFSPGRYYMQNLNFGAGRSLDISPDTSGLFAPRMLPTGNVTGQFWSFTRLGRM
ncbi:MAG: Ig-like domain-containing protein [Gemmatimonas sp.]